MKQSPSELAKVLLLLSRLKDTGWLLVVEGCIGMNLVDRRQVPKVRVRVPLHYFLLWGMGLLGVVACLASRIADGFDARILHHKFLFRGGDLHNLS